MTIHAVSYLQGVDGAPYKLPAQDHRLNHAGLWVPAGAAGTVTVRSGVLPGPGDPLGVTVVAGGVDVNPGHAVIQGAGATQGSYEFTSTAVEFRAITAASSTEFRRGRILALVRDRLNGGAADQPAIEVVYGPAAASAGAAQLPAIPAGVSAVTLREFAVSNTGAITLAGEKPRTGSRTGILPVSATDTDVGVYVGQCRDHPTYGLQRWTGSQWWRIGGPEIALTPFASDVELPCPAGVDTTLATATWTVPTAGWLEVTATWNYATAGTAACFWRLMLDGALARPQIRLHNGGAAAGGARFPVTLTTRIPVLAPGAHTVQMRCLPDPASATLYINNRQMFAHM